MKEVGFILPFFGCNRGRNLYIYFLKENIIYVDKIYYTIYNIANKIILFEYVICFERAA